MQPKGTESVKRGLPIIHGFLRKGISAQISRIRGSELKTKIANSMLTLGIGTVIEKGLRFVRNMILARLLARDQWGLIAFVFSVGMALEALGEVGVKQSIIQNKLGADRAYLNAAWWIQAVRCLCLFLTAFFAAPWISAFFEKPELLSLLRFSFLAILFRGLISPRAHVLEREYKFGRVVLLVQGSGMLGSMIAIGLAFYVRNVWALVIGFVAEPVIMCVMSYVLIPFVPSLKIDRTYLSEVMQFVRRMMGLPALVAICFQMDVFVLGKVVSGDELGLYYIAITLTQLPTELFNRIIRPVLLPTFSLKQNDKQKLCRWILRATHGIAIFGIPFVALMASCASGMILLAYGPKWVDITFPCAILSLRILTQIESVILAQLYMAVGRPNLQRRFAILRAVIMVALMYPASVRWGPLGAASVVFGASLIALIMQGFWCRRIIDLQLGTYLRCYIPGLLLALPIIVTVSGLLDMGVESFITLLIAGTAVFFLVCVLALYLVQRPGKKLFPQNISRIEAESA
jgi:lipopolysaccharide exporter